MSRDATNRMIDGQCVPSGNEVARDMHSRRLKMHERERDSPH